jgi:hypothetical protein
METSKPVVIYVALAYLILLLAAFVLFKYEFKNLSPVKRTGLQEENIRLNMQITGVAETGSDNVLLK